MVRFRKVVVDVQLRAIFCARAVRFDPVLHMLFGAVWPTSPDTCHAVGVKFRHNLVIDAVDQYPVHHAIGPEWYIVDITQLAVAWLIVPGVDWLAGHPVAAYDPVLHLCNTFICMQQGGYRGRIVHAFLCMLKHLPSDKIPVCHDRQQVSNAFRHVISFLWPQTISSGVCRLLRFPDGPGYS